MNEKKWFTNNGNLQLNIANDEAIVVATQNNNIENNELNDILNEIKEYSFQIKKANREELLDVIEMIKDELKKENKNKSRLRNCVTLLAPMLTISKEVPVLAEKISKLIDFVGQYI